jgi:PLD-like domain
MLQFLDQKALWPNLKKHLKRFKGKNLVAVPYLGKGAARLLGLQKGDILICALTERNAKSGLVCPAEIEKLQRRGVAAYISDNLHAKIYLVGDRVVVGSANASQNSKEILDEAALLTNDPATVKKVRQWFEDRILEPVTPKWLAYCKGIYKPPKRGPLKKTVGNTDRRRSTRGVWLLGVSGFVDFPEAEHPIHEAAERQAKSCLQNRRMFKIDSIRWPGSDKFLEKIKRGDIVIVLWKGSQVEPHARLLAVRRGKTERGTRVTYLTLETLKKYKTVSWKKFERHCADAGLRLGKGVSAREIRDVLHQNRVLSQTSPDKLRC